MRPRNRAVAAASICLGLGLFAALPALVALGIVFRRRRRARR
jgi:uncharacterized protein (TIGR03382 family)